MFTIPKCAVPECDHYYTKDLDYAFCFIPDAPIHPEKRLLWLERLNLDESKFGKKARVCRRHFLLDLAKRLRLPFDSLPLDLVSVFFFKHFLVILYTLNFYF